MQYYVIKDKKTNQYFRGKGVNRWGKYFNQATIYRVLGQAEFSLHELKLNYRNEDIDPVIVPIEIIENEVEQGEWIDRYGNKYANHLYECSLCKGTALWGFSANELGQEVSFQRLSPYCPNCGAKMKGE